MSNSIEESLALCVHQHGRTVIVVKDHLGNVIPCRITRIDEDAVGVYGIEVTLNSGEAAYTPEIEETIKASVTPQT